MQATGMHNSSSTGAMDVEREKKELHNPGQGPHMWWCYQCCQIVNRLHIDIVISHQQKLGRCALGAQNGKG